MKLDEVGPIVGIDFGTSGARAAWLVNKRPAIIENIDGVSTMPADVLVRADGTVAVGTAAKREGPTPGGVIVHAAKRLLGRVWADPALAEVKLQLGGSLVETEAGLPAIRVGSSTFTPAEICRLLFDHLRQTISAAIKADVTHAVLAVPADYGAIQRQALSAVAADAGLTIVRIVSEPTAAALHRGLGAENRTLAIYDLGGGTFDVTIVDIGDGVFEVLASAGDPFLGGEDIDARLLVHVLDQAGLNAAELTTASLFDIRTAVEAAKRELSTSLEAMLTVARIETTAGHIANVAQVLTRDQLQNLSQDLIDRTLVMCQRALDLVELNAPTRGAMTVLDIDEVILVGGTTRLPFIEECVGRFFGREPRSGSRREDSVALGCALYAGILTGINTEPLLLDVTPKPYGIQIDDEEGLPFLGRNVTFPTSAQRRELVCGAGVALMRFRVFEGEATDAQASPTVDEVSFSPTRNDAGQADLELKLAVDANGTLNLRVRDMLGGHHFDHRLVPQVNSTNNIATVAAASRPRMSDARAGDAAVVPQSRKILAVATEWSSGAGGLSTFNREFCLALSAAGHDVKCLVLSADAPDRQIADEGHVELIEAVKTPGQSEQFGLARKPRIDANWVPDLVIGHGRVTGPAATAIVDDHFPTAERMHLIHMAPDEIEWFKLDRTDDAGVRAEERTRAERELGSNAAYVVAVGPKLHNRYLTEFTGTGRTPLRLDPGFDSRSVVPIPAPPGEPWRVMLVGRAEDETLKGLDIAARALGQLLLRWQGPPIELIVRGAPEGTSEPLRRKLVKWAKVPGFKAVVRPFSPVATELAADYRRASLVLMPSRAEGFGLVGLEAICAGVPVLVSAESGLADLLKERLSPEEAARTIVAVTSDDKSDAETWSRAIERILLDRDTAFSHASQLRATLSVSVNWAMAVAELFDRMNKAT